MYEYTLTATENWRLRYLTAMKFITEECDLDFPFRDFLNKECQRDEKVSQAFSVIPDFGNHPF